MENASSARTGLPRWKWIGLAALIALLAFALLYDPLEYEYAEPALPASFEEYLKDRLQASEAIGVRPGNEERLVMRTAPGEKSEYAILYIHGFGASRAQGEYTVERAAERIGANVYYMRLPGHGADMEAHAAATWINYLNASETALRMMDRIGEHTIVVGGSTGALLATWLAAEHPDRVAAVVLASPLYGFTDPASFVLDLPGGMALIEMVYGEIRDASWQTDPEQRVQPGYADYWLTTQKYRAIEAVNHLENYIARDAVFRRITVPVLLLYYYENESRQDETASVDAMLEAFARFGALSKPHPLNRAVPVADGNHIMMSEYVRTDKAKIVREMSDFLDAVIAYRQDPTRSAEQTPARKTADETSEGAPLEGMTDDATRAD